MSRRVFSVVTGIAILLGFASMSYAQGTQDRPAQDVAAYWTVVEYPEGKELIVPLMPSELHPDAKGTVRVMRNGEETTVTLDASGLGDAGGYHLYAVSHEGKIVPLGVVTVSEGAASLSTKSNLTRFMLVLSPDADLNVIDASTRVALRSSVPDGLTVVPKATSAASEAIVPNPEETSEQSAATMDSENVISTDERSDYDVPLLGVNSLRRGKEIQLSPQLSGELTGTRTGVYVKPLKRGQTQVKVRFQEIKAPENGARFVLWAVTPEKTYTRLGQVDRPERRRAGRIDARTALTDFGLFITIESDAVVESPSGPTVAMVIR